MPRTEASGPAIPNLSEGILLNLKESLTHLFFTCHLGRSRVSILRDKWSPGKRGVRTVRVPEADSGACGVVLARAIL